MKTGIIGIAVVLILGSVGYNVARYSSTEEVTITVTDKERIVESNGDSGTTSKYLIFTEDENGKTETFENTDELFMGKWNSSDVQGGLKIGETYTVKVIGFRLSFFSTYRNIIEIK